MTNYMIAFAIAFEPLLSLFAVAAVDDFDDVVVVVVVILQPNCKPVATETLSKIHRDPPSPDQHQHI